MYNLKLELQHNLKTNHTLNLKLIQNHHLHLIEHQQLEHQLNRDKPQVQLDLHQKNQMLFQLQPNQMELAYHLINQLLQQHMNHFQLIQKGK